MSIKSEIKEFKLFGYALREQNRKIFERMMSELNPDMLEKASLAKDPFEVVVMALVFRQQKMIKRLLEEMEGSKAYRG